MTRLQSVIARALLAGAGLAFAAPFPSAAQVPSTVVARSTPNGLKVGEGRLHPFFDLEPRLDTAAGFFPSSANGPPSQDPSAELVMHLRPGVRFELPTPQVEVDFNGNIDYLYYTGLLAPGSYLASRLEGAANLNATFNRQGTVGFSVGDDFSYSDKTRNLALGVGAISLFNDVRGQLDIRPGGGALEISPRGSYSLELFQALSPVLPAGCSAGDRTCDPALVPEMNYGNVRAGLDARWKFLPKTAIVLESSFDFRTYAVAQNPSSMLLRVVGGLQGLLTTKVAVIAKGGWGYDFFTSPTAPGTNANTFLAHVEVAYLLTEASNFRAGYYRSLAPVPVFQTVRDDRIYGEARMLLSGRLSLRLYGALDFLGFGNASNRLDTAVAVDPGAEYEILPWLYAAAGYTLTVRSSDASDSATDNFVRQEAYLRLTAAY